VLFPFHQTCRLCCMRVQINYFIPCTTCNKDITLARVCLTWAVSIQRHIMSNWHMWQHDIQYLNRISDTPTSDKMNIWQNSEPQCPGFQPFMITHLIPLLQPWKVTNLIQLFHPSMIGSDKTGDNTHFGKDILLYFISQITNATLVNTPLFYNKNIICP
jgi:hypothetical protein